MMQKFAKFAAFIDRFWQLFGKTDDNGKAKFQSYLSKLRRKEAG